MTNIYIVIFVTKVIVFDQVSGQEKPCFHFLVNYEKCFVINEPSRGKTNNVVSEQIRHKLGCTSTEKS